MVAEILSGKVSKLETINRFQKDWSGQRDRLIDGMRIVKSIGEAPLTFDSNSGPGKNLFVEVVDHTYEFVLDFFCDGFEF